MTIRQIGLHLGVLGGVIVLCALFYWQSAGPRAVPALIDTLADEDASIRVHAAQALAAIGPAAKSAVPRLLAQAKHDPIQNAAAAAAGALKKIDLVATRDVMAISLSALRDKDVEIRRRACVMLGSMGPVAKPAVPLLREALNDEDDLVRDRAVRALGGIGIPAGDVIPALIRGLRDKASHVRHAAASQFAFTVSVPDEAIPALKLLLQDEDKGVASLAKIALGRTDRKEAEQVQVFVYALSSRNAMDYALLGLAMIGPKAVEAVPPLIPVLKDESSLHRYLAAEALGAIGPGANEAVPPLVQALMDEDSVVRDSAAWALEAIGTPEALKAVKGSRAKGGS